MITKNNLIVQKRIIALSILSAIYLIASSENTFAQATTDITSFDLTQVEAGWKAINTEFVAVILKVFKGILFAFMVWEIAEGWLHKNLNTKWMHVIGIGLFLGLLNMLPTIYKWITGYSATN